MIDNNCIHRNVCSHNGFVCESCDQCQFREHRAVNANKQVLDVDRLMEELENLGTDMCEHYELSKEKPIRGYSQKVIQEAIEACQDHAEEVVGVCIEHEWAEEENDRLISNFECPFCHEWHRENAVKTYCSQCGKPIKIVHKDRKKH